MLQKFSLLKTDGNASYGYPKKRTGETRSRFPLFSAGRDRAIFAQTENRPAEQQTGFRFFVRYAMVHSFDP